MCLSILSKTNQSKTLMMRQYYKSSNQSATSFFSKNKLLVNQCPYTLSSRTTLTKNTNKGSFNLRVGNLCSLQYYFIQL